jgi:sulfoxide reductase heme-binding subunit YedZ
VNEVHRRVPTGAIVAVAALIALTLGFAGIQLAGPGSQKADLAGAAITARWSFPLFITAWAASSLATLWPGGWRAVLLRRRRAVGLSFAASHFIHLGFVVNAVSREDVSRPLYVYLFGGGAYVMIALMAATSNDASQRWLGMQRWSLLHTVGGWWVLLIFANSYVGRLGEDPFTAIPAVVLIVLALVLRIAAVRTRRATTALTEEQPLAR